MSKEYEVKSKYKNPDKYIERLKTQLQDQRDWSEETRKELVAADEKIERLEKNAYGEHWFGYNKGVTKGVSFNDTTTSRKGSLYDTVWLKAKIINLTHSSNPKESEANFEISDVYLKKIDNK